MRQPYPAFAEATAELLMNCRAASNPHLIAVVVLCTCVASPALQSVAFADTGIVDSDALSRKKLADKLAPFYRVWSGQEDRFALRINGSIQIDGASQEIQVEVAKFDNQSFDFVAVHPEYAVSVHRRDDMTAMVLPKHNRVFVGKGEVEGTDTLVPLGISTRLASSASQIGTFVQMLGQGNSASLISLASNLIKIEQMVGEESWRLGGTVKLWFDKTDVDGRMHLAVDSNEVTVSLLSEVSPVSATTWSGLEQVTIDRAEMEEQFSRGIRRAWEVVWPSHELTTPKSHAKKTAHGELKYISGQRLVILTGTPEQIGAAHGELLKDESQRCIDSVLNAFGSVQTIVNGRWFRHDLAAAYARLRPFIPPDHVAETRALAVSLNQSPELLEQLNVFPEMFHCSGFAVFNSATVDGKLYHGRVLDYMTTIGLQDAATTFVVSVDGKIPFANVGYAGFTGSVSGMNAEAISLGEMGGRGEGQWDGVPMATLMRQALEECSTLTQVTDLWTKSPRTCEYYYVFADGKTNDAVGVAATPEKLELIGPGQADERLGAGIKDAVVLSAGSRLETLRARVTENFGKIDTQKAMWLMSRPVAMSSNLHNVLFVPADGVFYVANANHHQPAADRPYVKYDLNAILGDSGLVVGQKFQARDSLAIEIEGEHNADARDCLAGLQWPAVEFSVDCEPAKAWRYESLVRFPSAVDTGDTVNDRVALEWHMARGASGEIVNAPAVLVIHESGSKMAVGKTLAMLLSRHGLHAFMIHLPGYGERRSDARPTGAAPLIRMTRQSILDVRRARDAIGSMPMIEGDVVALQGTSLGGFIGSTAASLDGAFDGVFLMLCGGDLYDVLQHGKRDAEKMRRQLADEGLAGEDLRQLLQTIEPTRIAHRLPADQTWLFSGRFDTVVPLKNANLLAASIQLASEHHVIYDVDHYSGVVRIPEMVARIQTELKAIVREKSAAATLR